MSVGRPPIERVLETLPDRPLTKREVEVLETIDTVAWRCGACGAEIEEVSP